MTAASPRPATTAQLSPRRRAPATSSAATTAVAASASTANGPVARATTAIAGAEGTALPRRRLRRVREHIGSGSPLEPTIGFSRAVRDGRQVFVSATAAIWPDGHVDPDVGVQARRCLAIIEAALSESGATLRDVVRTRVFLVDAAHGDAVGQVHGEAFGRIRPATGFIIVQGFLD